MKNILLIFLIILLNGFACAQENNILKNSARIGIHGAYYGDEDIYMPIISAEYSHWLSNNLAIVPRVMRSIDLGPRKEIMNYKTSFAASVSLRFSPFHGWLNRVNFDVGGFYHRFKTRIYDIDFPLPGKLYNIRNTGGLMGAMNINFIDKNNLEAGFRTELLTNITGGYFKFESVLAGVYLGMKF